MKVSLKPFTVECEESEAWWADDTLTGICILCGATHEGECEPDARNYYCTECGNKGVYGFSELVMMGKVSITD
jgi:hypothetical protein